MISLLFASADGVQDTVQSIADTHDQIILALIALVASAVAILGFVIKNGGNVKIAADQATAANRAVNGMGPEHRLWDKVNRIEVALDTLVTAHAEFESHGWNNLPSDFDDAVSLTGTIRDIQHEQAECRDRLDSVKQILVEHVEWEMSQKYSHPD